MKKGTILGSLIAQNELLILTHSKSADKHTIYAVIVGEDPEDEIFAAELAEAWNAYVEKRRSGEPEGAFD